MTIFVPKIIWTERLVYAKGWFRDAHDSIKQVRKYTGEPYWVHTEWTMEKLAWLTNNENRLIGQLGHDFWEDVVTKNPNYKAEQVLELFGEEAYTHMKDLTDVYTSEAFPQYNRATRKGLEVKRIALVPVMSKNGKLADLIHNTDSIVNHDANFARIYLLEKWNMLKVLQEADRGFLAEATEQVKEGSRLLNLTLV